MSTGGTLVWAGVVVVGAVLIAPGLDRVAPPQPSPAHADAPQPQVQVQVGNG